MFSVSFIVADVIGGVVAARHRGCHGRSPARGTFESPYMNKEGAKKHSPWSQASYTSPALTTPASSSHRGKYRSKIKPEKGCSSSSVGFQAAPGSPGSPDGGGTLPARSRAPPAPCARGLP